MRTLVFCTAYADQAGVWERRHRRWLEALQGSDLQFDQLLIVDDGSPVLPEWTDLPIVREAEASTPKEVRSSAAALLYSHSRRLGRAGVFDFPGWYRSFAFGALYAQAHGFQKVIHLESDAFLLSPRIRRHFNEFSDGWSALWSARYAFPELALQVAAGAHLSRMAAFASEPYARLIGRVHELDFPFSHVEMGFVGDRYGESGAAPPRNVDFVAQATAEESAVHVQGSGAARTAGPVTLPDLASMASPVRVGGPFAEADLHGGWGQAERSGRWMIDDDSTLLLPPVQTAGPHRLELLLRPHVHQTRPGQRLHVLINDRMVGEPIVYRPVVAGYHVPEDALRRDADNVLRILHPDAFSPDAVGSPIADGRRLSAYLGEVVLTPLQPGVSGDEAGAVRPARRGLFARR